MVTKCPEFFTKYSVSNLYVKREVKKSCEIESYGDEMSGIFRKIFSFKFTYREVKNL